MLAENDVIFEDDDREVSCKEPHVTVVAWNGNDFADVEELRSEIFVSRVVAVVLSDCDFEERQVFLRNAFG